MTFSPMKDVIAAIRRGEIVVVLDAEDRENEGDFICAADAITPDQVNFMLQFGRGELCVTLTTERARELDLRLAEEHNTALNHTAFTIPVDKRTCKTGVSSAERAETIAALADPGTRPRDLARPGHVHPIVAQDGGVLRRAGHTEASVDLMKLAGRAPVGVLIEILDDNGEMARRDRLLEIAQHHKLKITHITELIKYRSRHEKLVERAASANLPTRFGKFRILGYEVSHEAQQPVAFVMGDLSRAQSPLVRMHSSCFTGDVLASLRCDCGDQLHIALEMIASEGVGAVVYLPQEGRGIGLLEKIKAYALQDEGHDTVEANVLLGYRADMRDYGVGIQILKDLGLNSIRLLTNNPKKIDSTIYDGYDLRVVDQIPLIAPPHPDRQAYLSAKRDKMGHMLPPDPVSLDPAPGIDLED